MSLHVIDIEIKPCPFCGHNAPRIEKQKIAKVIEEWRVVCGAGCGVTLKWKRTPEKAVELWNLRLGPPPKPYIVPLWQLRVVDEKNELDRRLLRLKAYTKTEQFDGLEKEDANLLTTQIAFMEVYSETMTKRIERFKPNEHRR